MHSSKITYMALALLIGSILLGQISMVHSDLPITSNLEATALTCLTEVYPVDLTHYNVTLDSSYTLSSPSDPQLTQAVDYVLNSADSNLIANFLFRDASLYSLSLNVINGSVIAAKPFANLTDAAADFLARYQAFSGADSTGMIRLLSLLDETQGTNVTSGGYTLRVSHLIIPNVINVTTFDWTYTADGPDIASVSTISLSFDNSTFYSGLTDLRQLHAAGSTQAISTALQFIQNYSFTAPDGSSIREFNATPSGVRAEFSGAERDGAMCPCWDVTVNLNQSYLGDVNALMVQVWADSGEVFNCTGVTLPVNNTTANLSDIIPPSPSSTSSNSVPKISSWVILPSAMITVVTAIFIVKKERNKISKDS